MQKAVYGLYKNGQVIFDDPTPSVEESKVIVVFLEERVPKPKLMDVFTHFGKWEDMRSAEEIITDVRNSRIAGADIQL